jgi:tRNA(Ile)-lysidine synthase
MLDEVRHTLRRERMLDPGQPVHVAVSGGVDSMVLLHVLRRLGHPCSVLHVDHGLRGAESDADRAFVEAYCLKEGIAFRCERVDVAGRARAKGLSVQMAARELRYAFFGRVYDENPRPVCLAHHGDDAVETFLLHLLRGPGVHGWQGMRAADGIHVRPLLGTRREAIEAYAQHHDVPFRTDASNTDPKYLRNRVRQELLPLMEDLRPGSTEVLLRSLRLFGDITGAALDIAYGRVFAQREPTGSGWRLPVPLLHAPNAPLLSLHLFLEGKGFHPDAVIAVHDAVLHRRTGARFRAGPWEVVVDREHVVLQRVEGPMEPLSIERDAPPPEGSPVQWSWEEGPLRHMPVGGNEVVLDADALSFPLLLRPWRAGDRLRPEGLGGSKLVSDILTDAKVGAAEKPGAMVLTSGDHVVWVVGYRLAEGFRAQPSCRSPLRLWVPRDA